MTGEWADELRDAVDGIENGIQRLRRLGAYPPVNDLESLAMLWSEINPGDDIDNRAATIKRAGETITSHGPEAMARALGQLENAIGDRLTTASVGEVHGAGFIRTSDFKHGIGSRPATRADGSTVHVAIGVVAALEKNHPLRDVFPEGDRLAGGVIALGLVENGVRRFYRLQTAVGITRALKAEELEKARREGETHDRQRWESKRHAMAAERNAKARVLAGELGIDPDAMATVGAGGAAE